MDRAIRTRLQLGHRRLACPLGRGHSEQRPRQHESMLVRLRHRTRLQGDIIRPRQHRQPGPSLHMHRTRRRSARLQQRVGLVQRARHRGARHTNAGRHRRIRCPPSSHQRAQSRRGGIGIAPTLAIRQPQQPRPQHTQPRIIRRRRRYSLHGFRQTTRLGRQDLRAAPRIRQPGINRLAIAREQVNPLPQRRHHLRQQPPIGIRQPRQHGRDLRQPARAQLRRPPRQLRRVIGRDLPAIRQRQQSGDPLVRLLATEQMRIVAAQSRRQQLRHPVHAGLVHGQPGASRRHHHPVAGRRQPDRPVDMREERHQPVIVGALLHRGQCQRHVPRQPVPQPGRIQQRRKR